MSGASGHTARACCVLREASKDNTEINSHTSGYCPFVHAMQPVKSNFECLGAQMHHLSSHFPSLCIFEDCRYVRSHESCYAAGQTFHMSARSSLMELLSGLVASALGIFFRASLPM